MAKKKNSVFSAIAEANNTIVENAADVVKSIATGNNEFASALSAANEYLAEYAGKDSNDSVIENLKVEISRLNAVNSELTEKLAVYVENSVSANTACVSAELEKLRYEKNTLQNENDTYLMKISELSFENAKLTSQLQQLQSLSKDNHELPPPIHCENSTSKQNVVMAKSNYVPYIRTNGNGYNSWN